MNTFDETLAADGKVLKVVDSFAADYNGINVHTYGLHQIARSFHFHMLKLKIPIETRRLHMQLYLALRYQSEKEGLKRYSGKAYVKRFMSQYTI